MKSCTLPLKKSSAKPVSLSHCSPRWRGSSLKDAAILSFSTLVARPLCSFGVFVFRWSDFDVVAFVCMTGSRGGITQVKVAFMGNVKRTLVRNVKGPVRKNDILALLESEREARRLR